jgi:hypothetical protein
MRQMQSDAGDVKPLVQLIPPARLGYAMQLMARQIQALRVQMKREVTTSNPQFAPSMAAALKAYGSRVPHLIWVSSPLSGDRSDSPKTRRCSPIATLARLQQIAPPLQKTLFRGA